MLGARSTGCSQEAWKMPDMDAESRVRKSLMQRDRVDKAESPDRSIADRQLFNRYPVLKIHATITRKMARNSAVMPRLTATSTSAKP
jgi:hypothetical protein